MPPETIQPLWDKRLPRETRTAFEAFKRYRDFGWQRSIAKVYRQFKSIPDSQPVAVPGTWFEWSSKHTWTARADAYDAHQDQIEGHQRDKYAVFNARRIAKRQGDFEWKRQIALEDQFERADEILKKAEAAPIVDVTRNEEKVSTDDKGKKVLTISKTKIKGINYSGYARLIEQKFAVASDAGLGPRHQQTVKHEISGNDGGPIQIVISPADAKL